jgi:hypothetical protein
MHKGMKISDLEQAKKKIEIWFLFCYDSFHRNGFFGMVDRLAGRNNTRMRSQK